jgi:hypothetical protein
VSRWSTPDTRSAEGPGDLARLLETEQRLEGELRITRERAELLRHEAIEAARRREAGIDAALAAAEQALTTEIGAERGRREAEITADADRTIARYEGLDDSRLAAVAGELVTRLLAGWGEAS